MIGKLKILGVAAVIALSPLAAKAATIYGQIDISGLVNLPGSTFTAAGGVDLENPGNVLQATGSFAAEGVSAGNVVTLADIDFTAPGAIWSVGGFTFTATNFSNIVDGAYKTFKAVGLVSFSGGGLDDTQGTLSFSAQDGQTKVSFSSTTVVPVPAAGFLLVGALGALGVARRRKKAA